MAATSGVDVYGYVVSWIPVFAGMTIA